MNFFFFLWLVLLVKLTGEVSIFRLLLPLSAMTLHLQARMSVTDEDTEAALLHLLLLLHPRGDTKQFSSAPLYCWWGRTVAAGRRRHVPLSAVADVAREPAAAP